MTARQILFRIHMLGGLAAGIVILVLGLTGAIMAFEPELNRLAHWHLWHVTPGASTLSIAGLDSVVHRAYPEDSARAYAIATAPGLSDQVILRDRTVYV